MEKNNLKNNYNFLDNRIKALYDILQNKKIDALFLTSKTSQKYFADYLYENGFIIASKDKLIFITDKRFLIEIQSIDNRFEKIIYNDSILKFIFKEKLLNYKRIGIESNDISLKFFNEMKKYFSKVNFIDISMELKNYFSICDDEILKRFKKAVSISKMVYKNILNEIRENITESDIAAEILYLTKKLGADDVAFLPIVAFGENSAKPHSIPSNRKLKNNEVVLIDLGATYKGISCDFTRTIFFGQKVDKEFFKLNVLIKKILKNLFPKIQAKIKVKDLDLFVREELKKYNLEINFNHALGHGVGLEIHQAPRISKYSNELLSENMIIAIEPGIYFPDKFGIRIENDYLVTSEKTICLTNFK